MGLCDFSISVSSDFGAVPAEIVDVKRLLSVLNPSLRWQRIRSELSRLRYLGRRWMYRLIHLQEGEAGARV